MQATYYDARRRQLEEYFDRTAVEAWARLTSNEPVGRIRATVRAGRDKMRATLLSYLPDDLGGQRVLDAGCGTGALAVEVARRGADVVAIDLSPTLIQLARERTALESGSGTIDFRVSDMLDPSLGAFDWVVAMDSLIHYRVEEMTDMIGALAARAARGVVFTFAPKTPLLAVMHVVGKAFPRGSRAPDIEPVAERELCARLERHPITCDLAIGRSERVDIGFYTSQAMELRR